MLMSQLEDSKLYIDASNSGNTHTPSTNYSVRKGRPTNTTEGVQDSWLLPVPRVDRRTREGVRPHSRYGKIDIARILYAVLAYKKMLCM